MNKDIKKLWQKLGDIPIDKDENIEETFLHFNIGTNRFEIWHWFEEEYNISITELMFSNKG